MANDNDNVDIEKDIKNLKSFLKELENILKDVQKSDVLAKTATKYEQNLTKLISTTKGIINNTATKEQAANFEKLLHKTDMSLKVLRRQNKSDEEFKSEFKKVFGDIRENQEVSESILKKLSSSVVALTKSVAIINASSRQDVQDTALSFFTGPFGKILDDAVDFSGAKEAISSRFGGDSIDGQTNTNTDSVGGKTPIRAGVDSLDSIGKQAPTHAGINFVDSIDGQAHDGNELIPKEGTYNLDGGERVIEKNQNQDLTEFLKESTSNKSPFNETLLSDIEKNTRKSDAIKVFNEDHDSRYFDSIIDNDDRIAVENENSDSSRHSGLMTKFEILADVINKSNLSFLTNLFIQFDLWTKRFMRHPVLNTLALIMKPISFAFSSVWKALFGKKKTETDRIVESNEDIADILLDGEKKDRRVLAKKILDSVVGGFGGLIKKSTAGIFQNINKQLPQKRDAKGRFAKRDKTEILIDSMKELVKISRLQLGIDDEMLDKLKEGGRGAGRGLMGLLGRGKGLLFKLAKTLLPVAGALFAGFKLGQLLNEKFGEWLNLDMDLGSFIGGKVFDFVESITSIFDDIGNSIREHGFTKTLTSIISGQGIPDTENQTDKTVRQRKEKAAEIKENESVKQRATAIRNVGARHKAGEFTDQQKEQLIDEIMSGKDFVVVPVDKSVIKQQNVTSKVVVPQAGQRGGGVVNNNNVVNNNTTSIKERLRPHVESAMTSINGLI